MIKYFKNKKNKGEGVIMRKIIAESLVAVHTHTHTHTFILVNKKISDFYIEKTDRLSILC